MVSLAAAVEPLMARLSEEPLAMAHLARLLVAQGQGERARQLCAHAVEMAPSNGQVRTIAAEVFSHDVSPWHFDIVKDLARNAAYDQALRRAVTANSRVLEIGAGSGLLAMMAARAGAAKVVTCESNPAVAAVASEIVVRNDLQDRVRVVAKHSDDLEIGIDLDRPADILVSEIISNDMLGQSALPIIERAARRLLRQGARVIPARGAVRVALAEDQAAGRKRMGIVDGFDLSPFNRLAAPRYGIRVGASRLVLRSEPHDLFNYDFQSGGPFPARRASVQLSTQGGLVNGIAQWIRLDMDDDGSYENAPSIGAYSAWDILFFPLAHPINVSRGKYITVCGASDRLSLRVWAKEA